MGRDSVCGLHNDFPESTKHQPRGGPDPFYGSFVTAVAEQRAAVFGDSSNATTLNFKEELPLLIDSTFIVVSAT